MKRKRTAIGLALLSLLAVGVTGGGIVNFAHSEEINGEYTAVETPGGKNVEAVYEGTQASPQSFITANAQVECKEGELAALVEGGVSPEITATPFYGECDLIVPVKLPVTIDHNECDYTFQRPTEQKKDEYSSVADLFCPAGKKGIEITIFEFGNTKMHSGLLCTITFLEAEKLSKTTYTDKTTAPTLIHTTAKLQQMPYETKGDCPDGEGKFADGEFEGDITLHATAGLEEKQVDAVID